MTGSLVVEVRFSTQTPIWSLRESTIESGLRSARRRSSMTVMARTLSKTACSHREAVMTRVSPGAGDGRGGGGGSCAKSAAARSQQSVMPPGHPGRPETRRLIINVINYIDASDARAGRRAGMPKDTA